MKAAVVAFAFGTPNILRSNRYIAEMAAMKAGPLRVPIYTQYDILPVADGVEIEHTPEKYPDRVPTLRIARGAVAWALRRGIDVFWLCAADPHLARCSRDMHYAIREANATIEVRIVQGTSPQPIDFWFCLESRQTDTRNQWIWKFRDTILMHLPMYLYSRIAS